MIYGITKVWHSLTTELPFELFNALEIIYWPAVT